MQVPVQPFLIDIRPLFDVVTHKLVNESAFSPLVCDKRCLARKLAIVCQYKSFLPLQEVQLHQDPSAKSPKHDLVNDMAPFKGDNLGESAKVQDLEKQINAIGEEYNDLEVHVQGNEDRYKSLQKRVERIELLLNDQPRDDEFITHVPTAKIAQELIRRLGNGDSLNMTLQRQLQASMPISLGNSFNQLTHPSLVTPTLKSTKAKGSPRRKPSQSRIDFSSEDEEELSSDESSSPEDDVNGAMEVDEANFIPGERRTIREVKRPVQDGIVPWSAVNL